MVYDYKVIICKIIIIIIIGVGIFQEGLRFSSIVSVIVKQFSRGGRRGKIFSGRLKFFLKVFILFLEGWN